MPLRPRDAVMIPNTGSQYDPGRPHLYFILTPVDEADKILAVPVGSVRSNPDKSCLLNVGDHDFIVKPSYIMYAYARLLNHGPLWAAVKRGEISQFAPASDALFARICAGMRASDFAKRQHIKMLSRLKGV